jgi:hypothetical protein
MENNNQKIVQFSSEEYIKVGEIARPFWENGKSDNPPKFVIIMGGVGSGKTTERKQKFSDGFVNFEFGDILNAVKNEVGEDNPKLENYASLASNMILKESLAARKNIVIEIIGEKSEMITPVIDKMKEVGYAVSINGITCDPTEAYERHLKAVEEDKNYLSAYFTQEATLSFFYQQFELGQMPVSVKK